MKQAIGSAIKLKRNKKNLSKQQFADKMQVTLETINNWESGRREPLGINRINLKKLGIDIAQIKREWRANELG